ncbi:hypothetical protein [Ktedonospora formicarum]|uniref:Uncharacterized protein n=1 Tax=Ktedonospora formicarum TaxID=2778364 RepID=A0A8J3I3U4_9CHLR|nr:hypothetical protein [Ktedonospora formicarum]GHO46298.1 hypothetical protein KSX_44610 [Ktedonospora formicarum]
MRQPELKHESSAQTNETNTDTEAIRSYMGWYPRWWLLSAFFSSLIVITGLAIWDTWLCSISQLETNAALICHLKGMPYLIQIVLIWLLFALLWLLMFIFCFKPIEVSSKQQGRIANLLRAASNFKPLRPVLVVQGILSWLLIIILWWRDDSPPVAIAMLAICVFLAHTHLFYRSTSERKRLYLSAYGMLCLSLLFIELLFKRNFQTHLSSEWPLISFEIIMVFIGIGAMLWHHQPDTQTSIITQPLPIRQHASRISPLTVFSALWPFNHLFPPR